MTTPDPDAYWRRPSNGDAPPPAAPDEKQAPPEYTGPPRNTRPAQGWRVPMVAEPHQPRKLPEQDTEAIDASEQQARTFTYGVGLLAGSVVLILMFVICARLIG